MRSRPSYDQVRPLPTVTERPIERFNSTASVAVGDAISIPITSMRYQTRHVNVHRPPVKHNSLPSTLPSFPSQTSLMDDLSTWIIPGSARESYRQSQSFNIAIPDNDTAESILIESLSAVQNSPPSNPSTPLDAATEPSVEELSTYSSPIPRNIPALPSRPPPLVPSSNDSGLASLGSLPSFEPGTMLHSGQDHTPQISAPSIHSVTSSEIDAMTYPVSNESLHRAPSDPIPPPFVRRRRPVPSPSRNTHTDVEETPKTSPTTNRSPIHATPIVAQPQYTATMDVAEQSNNAAQPLKVNYSSAKRDLSPEVQQGKDITDPDLGLSEQNTIDTMSSIPPPVLASPQKSTQHTTGTLPSAASHHQHSIHPTPSNASATDKYPISVALDNFSYTPIISTQSLPNFTNRTIPLSDLRHVRSNASATDKYPIALSPTSAPPHSNILPDSPPACIASDNTPDNGTPPSQHPIQPMTALEKRRAAHAKRMQMAFEPDSSHT